MGPLISRSSIFANSLARIVIFLESSFLHHKMMARQICSFVVAAVFLHARQLDLVFAFKTHCEYELMFRIPKTVSQINVSASWIS